MDSGVSRLASPSAKYVRFIVLGEARTGSYMLVQALDSHPNVTCFSELFNSGVDFVDFKVPGYDNRSAADRSLRDNDFECFLRERIFCGRDPTTQAVGFKLLYAHFWDTNGLLEALIDDTEIRIVHLKRRNLLRMLVSTRLAQASGIWRRDLGPQEPLVSGKNLAHAVRHPLRAAAAVRRRVRPPVPHPDTRAEKSVALSVEECDRFFITTRIRDEHFAGLFSKHPSIAVSYEDMVEDRRRVFASVQAFLGVQSTRLQVTLARQNPEPLSELIENYGELKSHYRGTPEDSFFS